ncbi:MAG: TolC family protein [Pseudomonadota bacterium]
MQLDRWPLDPADYDKQIPQKDYLALQVPADLKPLQAKAPPPFDQASGKIKLSLEQAVYAALRGNRELMVQQYKPMIAGAFEQIERGAFDPELFAELLYSEERTSEVSRSTEEQFNVQATDSFGILGLRQRLPTGTTVELSASQERNTSNRTPEQQDTRLGLSVTQSLLRGLGPVVNLVAVRQAELETQASLYELRGFTEATLAEAEIAYWEFVLAEREISIFQRSLEVARQQLQEIEQRIEVGMLPNIEAAAARAEVARREQAMIEAQSALEDRRLKLLRIVNPAGGLGIEVRSTSNPGISPQPITDVASRVAVAQRVRPDLNEARLRWRQNRLETIATRNGLLPKLDLFVVLGKTGYAQSFGESVSNLDGPNYDIAAGLRLSQYLGNREAKGRHTAALATARQAAAAVENLTQLVGLDVRLAANQVGRARRQISATRLTRELQEQTVEAEKERFDVGKSTSLLVAQAQRDLLASQINEAQAILYYRIALVRLYLAEGSLLERRGVEVAKGQDLL